MTTKQIAEAVGKPEKTVRNWASRASAKLDHVRAKLDQASATKKPADFDLDETCVIIEHGLGKNAASLYRENAKRSQPPASLDSSSLDAAFKAAVITLTAMAQSLDARLTKIETRIDERQALLPAPALEPRQRINMLVREYATKTGATFPDAWGSLYREFGYRMHMNPGQCARNRGMTILDYIEAEGLIGDLEAIAADWAR